MNCLKHIVYGLVVLGFGLIATLVLGTMAFLLCLPILLIPSRRWRMKLEKVPAIPYYLFGKVSYFVARALVQVRYTVDGDAAHFDQKGTYVMMCNHQSWLDISLLVAFFLPRVPRIKFFMKKELLWQLPFASWYCYLNGFPFLSRGSRSKQNDVDVITQACHKVAGQPGSFMIFPEGTRYTQAKARQRQTPFQYLLPAKAKGLAMTVNALKDQLKGVINITIAYEPVAGQMKALILGRVSTVHVGYEFIPAEDLLFGDYRQDPDYKAQFNDWLHQLWLAKDRAIAELVEHE